jgi:hypothetical protein
MTEVTGWRCWSLGTPDGALWGPMSGTEWAPEPVRATCWHGHDHPAPDPDCQCGIKAVTDLDGLIRRICFDVDGQPKNLGRYRDHPDLRPPYLPKAVGQVTLSGRILGPAAGYDEPGTIRGEYATVTGPLFFARDFGGLAQAAADLYACDVIVSDLSPPQWMIRAHDAGGGLAADVRAYADDPGSLGPRLYRPAALQRHDGDHG